MRFNFNVYSPDLTWRDIQYLIIYTSDTTNLLQSGEWSVNHAGLKVSPQFGFGAIDAEAMVTRAKHWTNVPEQLHSSMNSTIKSGYGQNEIYSMIAVSL